MAQQMILAANERRKKLDIAEATGFIGRRRKKNLDLKQASLRQALAEQKHRLANLFSLWDEDGNGEIDEKEFRRALRMLGLKPSPADFTAFLALCDEDGSGNIGLDELQALLDATPPPDPPEPEPPKAAWLRAAMGVYWIMNTTAVQTILYFTFVMLFQLLTDCLRKKQEYFLDKALADTFIDNHFDPHLNSFKTMRRVADVWEWGNEVLWPGLLANNGPGCGVVGLAGTFQSASDETAPSDLGAAKGGCNDDVWPDGDGHFGLRNGTAWTVDEIARRMDSMDWTRGITIWQTRVQALPSSACSSGGTLSGVCLPEHDDAVAEVARTDFGFNWTHPSSPLAHPFRWFSASDLGSNPEGQLSAHASSFRQLPAGGFSSFIVPFFSDVFLPEQRGGSDAVIDFRNSSVTRTNGRVPRHFCVRLSWNGVHMHQLCDPNDANGRTTGAVRAAVEEFWNDLKRAHFIDSMTRAMIVTISFSSNNVGVETRARFMVELLSTSSVLPSYDVQTRVSRPSQVDAAKTYSTLALVFCFYFIALEVVEITSAGFAAYFQDCWNIMDWLNFLVFFFVYGTLQTYFGLLDQSKCALVCETTGYADDWEVMGTFKMAKMYLSMCVCIQLLKIIKFLSVLVPKMDLAPLVLKRALPDLVFFGLVFLISLYAFSAMFFVQLGPVLVDFNDQAASIVSLGRALFGDFSIDEILDNSTGYDNALFFLSYMFVAVFVLLSMFFAILGESQAMLRDEQHESTKDGEVPPGVGYGVLSEAYKTFRHGLMRIPVAGEKLADLIEKIEEEEKASEIPEATPLDRIEARLLELSDKVEEIMARLDGKEPARCASSGASSSGAGNGMADPEVLKALEEIKSAMNQHAARAAPKRRSREKHNRSPPPRAPTGNCDGSERGERHSPRCAMRSGSPSGGLVADGPKLLQVERGLHPGGLHACSKSHASSETRAESLQA